MKYKIKCQIERGEFTDADINADKNQVGADDLIVIPIKHEKGFTNIQVMSINGEGAEGEGLPDGDLLGAMISIGEILAKSPRLKSNTKAFLRDFCKQA